ncbi:MAG: ABC transporter ATP-binding protein [Planctomycetota bacterium]
MKLEIRHRCDDFNSYRAARVKSLFNCDDGHSFNLDADLPIEDQDWKIGVVVGPSGSGKTSIGRRVFGDAAAMWEPSWPDDKPIVDAIATDGDFNAVMGALAAVGLGSVPAWLRPYSVLSRGEQFRADMAKLVSEAPDAAVVDEFTSVVDRQIAQIGSLAFAKAWRRTGGQVVLLTPHYDVLDWLQPCWTYDTSSGEFAGRWVRPRPKYDLEIWQTDWRYWPLFEPHHYLKLPRMIGAKVYVGVVDGEPVSHLAVSTAHVGKGGVEARACRLVVMPEYQGAGVGMRFLNQICQWQLEGSEHGRIPGRRLTTMFHTSHPGLAMVLRRSKLWRQVSAKLHGSSKKASRKTLRKAGNTVGSGYGGHFRAVQGFRYVGEAA